MSSQSGRWRTRQGDVVIASTSETRDDDGLRILDVHLGEPAVWSTPAFRIVNPPELVMTPDRLVTEDADLAVAEALAAAGGVMIVRERR